MASFIEFLGSFYPYLLGGIGGATLTLITNKVSNKLQKMVCYYVDDEVISRIPVLSDKGEQHQNIYYKEFKIINTTNKDISKFKIIFEFDADSKIVKHSTFLKSGKDVLRPRGFKGANEIIYEIRNFNRSDYAKFYFDVANISNGHFNVTEADCLGFKISTKDKRKAKKTQNSKIVTKEELSKR
ncbi:MAG: hypothetical protein GQ564_19655 [Bacteroidales bacterium]|nr:hypothetical protein [Bacteroidales bacterium]